jgi:hypothetical protein
MSNASTQQSVGFTLRKIPRQNLSPFSDSGVTLKIGQKKYAEKKLKGVKERESNKLRFLSERFFFSVLALADLKKDKKLGFYFISLFFNFKAFLKNLLHNLLA